MKVQEVFKGIYYETYNVARVVDLLVSDKFANIRLVSELFNDDAILAYTKPFPKFSALHNFTYEVVMRMFENDLSGPNLIPDEADFDSWKSVAVLPIERAFVLYNVPYQSFESYSDERGLPHPPAGLAVHFGHTAADDCETCSSLDLGALANRYHDYWIELTLTEPLDVLVRRICDEVFFVMFTNRRSLGALNLLLAEYVSELDPDFVNLEVPDLLQAGANGAKLKRATIPNWVKRAVEFRDRGRCSFCQAELGTLRTPMSRGHYDHIVPLASGGLNDVTNMQLLCASCNQVKADNAIEPGAIYERWYPL